MSRSVPYTSTPKSLCESHIEIRCYAVYSHIGLWDLQIVDCASLQIAQSIHIPYEICNENKNGCEWSDGCSIRCTVDNKTEPLESHEFMRKTDIRFLDMKLVSALCICCCEDFLAYYSVLDLGSAEVTQLLLEAGAIPDKENDIGKTASQLAGFVGTYILAV